MGGREGATTPTTALSEGSGGEVKTKKMKRLPQVYRCFCLLSKVGPWGWPACLPGRASSTSFALGSHRHRHRQAGALDDGGHIHAVKLAEAHLFALRLLTALRLLFRGHQGRRPGRRRGLAPGLRRQEACHAAAVALHQHGVLFGGEVGGAARGPAAAARLRRRDAERAGNRAGVCHDSGLLQLGLLLGHIGLDAARDLRHRGGVQREVARHVGGNSLRTVVQRVKIKVDADALAGAVVQAEADLEGLQRGACQCAQRRRGDAGDGDVARMGGEAAHVHHLRRAGARGGVARRAVVAHVGAAAAHDAAAGRLGHGAQAAERAHRGNCRLIYNLGGQLGAGERRCCRRHVAS
mmetsp:Transcript_46760/g.119290  ORF Transcript_46760/g.119290 Transcript_46760/m.119290 type:complete len:351 (-) Transcript_46760:58-1110(-)